MDTSPREVRFAGSQGFDLSARLDLPDDPPRAVALFAHCFTCSKDVFAASRIASGLVRLGIGVLRFDFTGLGSSDGEFANTDFTSNTEDIETAAEWLRRNHRSPGLLIGHSLGGAAVLAVAENLPSVRAVVSIAAPSDLTHIEGTLGESVTTIEQEGEARVVLAGRSFRIRREFLEDMRSTRLLEHVAEMRKPVLVLHSPTDRQVGIEHAARIYDAARHPKSFIALDGADHLITNREDAVYAARLIAAWSRRYLDPRT